MKDEIPFVQDLPQVVLVFRCQTNDAEDTFFEVYVFQCCYGFRLLQGQGERCGIDVIQKLDEEVDDKGIVVTGNLKFQGLLFRIMIVNFLCIGQDFFSQVEKFNSFTGKGHT